MICKQCNQEFKKSYPKEERKFCGFKCYWKSMEGDNPRKYKIKKETIKITANCKLCNIQFHKKRSKTVYCSVKCRSKSSIKNKNKEEICLFCKKVFMTLKHNGRKTCSKECLSMLYRGSNNPSWKGGIKKDKDRRKSFEMMQWRKSVFERDNFTCQKCFKRGGKLFPHHIFFYAKFIDLRAIVDNGITLCDYCHKLTHKYIPKNYFDKMNQKQITEIIEKSNFKKWLFSFYNDLE